MNRPPALRVRFWGVRGSYPVPGRATAHIGGNSSCVEVTAGAHTLVFDAGTGLIGLGRTLLRRRGAPAVHIFLSHTHHDHIEGLRFFEPVYRAGWACHVYGSGDGRGGLQRLLAGLMEPRLFPVTLDELAARVIVHPLGRNERVRLPGRPPVEVQARHSRAHPKVGVMLYRVACGNRSVVYATDVEGPQGGFEDVVEFARGADLLIHDAQYTDEEYFGTALHKVGWGHSTVAMAAEAARVAGVGRLLLYHHDPRHDDAVVRRLERQARAIFPRSRAAREGVELRLPFSARARRP